MFISLSQHNVLGNGLQLLVDGLIPGCNLEEYLMAASLRPLSIEADSALGADIIKPEALNELALVQNPAHVEEFGVRLTLPLVDENFLSTAVEFLPVPSLLEKQPVWRSDCPPDKLDQNVLGLMNAKT